MGLVDFLGIADLHCSVLVLFVLNSMFRLGLVNTLVTHTKEKGFGLASLSGVHRGYMPPWLKTKQTNYYHSIKVDAQEFQNLHQLKFLSNQNLLSKKYT